jgi:hypothetical protein
LSLFSVHSFCLFPILPSAASPPCTTFIWSSSLSSRVSRLRTHHQLLPCPLTVLPAHFAPLTAIVRI